jgi:hypothetical protein
MFQWLICGLNLSFDHLAGMISGVRKFTGPSKPDSSSGESLV